MQKSSKGKRIKRAITSISLALTMLLTPIASYADELDDFLSKVYENINGSNASVSGVVKHGVVEANQGWVIYGIDKYGNEK